MAEDMSGVNAVLQAAVREEVRAIFAKVDEILATGTAPAAKVPGKKPGRKPGRKPAAAAAAEVPEKKKPGRKPKVAVAEAAPTERKKPGRKPKEKVPGNGGSPALTKDGVPRKKPGRKPKVAEPAAPASGGGIESLIRPATAEG